MPVRISTGAGDHKIFDIRQDVDRGHLSKDIINGLSSEPASLPSVLLWNEKGLELFDRFSQTPSYYPYHSEIEILKRCASEIASSVPPGGAIVELGCGTIRKTKTILSILDLEQKPIRYYALDLSRQGLAKSIMELSGAMRGSKSMTITGLLGTYEDCVSWLSKPENLEGLPSITFLWMGNSIANFSHHSEASAFLARFKSACQLSHIACNFILSTDICQQECKINDAYNLEKSELRDWLFHGLTHANTALGRQIFRFEDWKIETEFDSQEHGLQTYYTALSDFNLLVDPGKGPPIVFSKGTRVRIITSGKWSEEIMGEMCNHAELRIQQRWKDVSGAYCVYLLSSVGR